MGYKIKIMSTLLALSIFAIVPANLSATEINTSNKGDYYASNHLLFMEEYPASFYQLSDNTQLVKDILKNDDSDGYLGFPVNIRLNEIAPGENKEVLFFTEMGGMTMDEFKNSDYYNILNENQRKALEKYYEQYMKNISSGLSGGGINEAGGSGIDGIDTPDSDLTTVKDVWNNTIKGTI